MYPFMKSTVGENIFAILMSGIAAAFAAVMGFVSAIILCSTFLRGEVTEWDLILAPVTAVVFSVSAFVFAFRKISTYGENPDKT